MEITCRNFNSHYTNIENAVRNASFAAIDVEFLGLDTAEEHLKCSLFDSPHERFVKLRESVLRFPPAQLGIALFTAQKEEKRYKVDVYNVYLFKSGFQSQQYSFSVSSLSFLEAHGFDFNQFVVHGVSHVNLDELNVVINKLKTHGNGIDSFGPKMSSVLSNVQNTLHSRLARLRRKSTGSEGATTTAFAPFSLNLGKEDLNDLQKTVILYKLYSSVPGIRMKILDNMLECDSTRLTKRELAQIKDDLLLKISRELMGASEIVMTMIETKIPIIGHNMFYDLLYLYQYFVADLPEDYDEFKSCIHKVFPTIIDTKSLAEECKDKLSWHGVMSYRLESLGTFFDSKSSVRSVPELSFEFGAGGNLFSKRISIRKRKGRSGYHNAAFDAFTTGRVLLKLAHLCAIPIYQQLGRGNILPIDRIMQEATPIINRIPIPLLSVPFIDLDGEDPPPRNPEDIVMIPSSDDTCISSFKKELQAEFGKWRCDMKMEDGKIFIATNTDTTYRRVYNYCCSSRQFKVLEKKCSSTSLSSSTSSSSTPCEPGTPTSSFGLLDLNSAFYPKVDNSALSFFSKWCLAGSILLGASAYLDSSRMPFHSHIK